MDRFLPKRYIDLHARNLDFHATVTKARQFADATGQDRAKKRVNFIDTRPKSPTQPDWEPLLQGFKDMVAEALQPLQRALRSQTQGSAPRPTASTSPQSRPATQRLNPSPRGAWQNQQPRNAQGFRGGTANQSGGSRCASFQPQARNDGTNRPHTPPNSLRNQQQFQPRSVTSPVTDRLRHGPGCFVCGERRCHTEIQRRNGTLPQNYRRPPPARGHQRNRDTASGLNANARVFTPSGGQR